MTMLHKLNFLFQAAILGAIILFTSCSNDVDRYFKGIDANDKRAQDSVWCLYHYGITYQSAMWVKYTMTLYSEPPAPQKEPVAIDTIRKKIKMKVVDFQTIPDCLVCSSPSDYAKISYDGGEGWQQISTIIHSTDADNWTRFLPKSIKDEKAMNIMGFSTLLPSFTTLCIFLILALVYWQGNKIMKKRSPGKGNTGKGFSQITMVLYLLVSIIGLIIGWMNFNNEFYTFLRLFWNWSLHPFSGKLLIVLSLLVIPVVYMLIRFVVRATQSVSKSLWHIIGVLSTAIAILLVTLIAFFVAIVVLFMTVFSLFAGTAYTTKCPYCGAAKPSGGACPKCNR